MLSPENLRDQYYYHGDSDEDEEMSYKNSNECEASTVTDLNDGNSSTLLIETGDVGAGASATAAAAARRKAAAELLYYSQMAEKVMVYAQCKTQSIPTTPPWLGANTTSCENGG